MEQLRRIIEALLFAAPEPLTVARIKAVVPGTEDQEILDSVDELRREYDDGGRACQVVEVANGWQLTTRPDYSIWVDKLFESRAKAKLSRAALETLAVIAYKQPVVRAAIEGIRGVNVDSVLRTLMERDLVRMVGRADGPGRPLLFGTTKEFLMRFGITRISDLPKLEEIEELAGTGAAGAPAGATGTGAEGWYPGEAAGGGGGVFPAAGAGGPVSGESGGGEMSAAELERREYREAADSVEEMLRGDTEDEADDVAQGQA